MTAAEHLATELWAQRTAWYKLPTRLRRSEGSSTLALLLSPSWVKENLEPDRPWSEFFEMLPNDLQLVLSRAASKNRQETTQRYHSSLYGERFANEVEEHVTLHLLSRRAPVGRESVAALRRVLLRGGLKSRSLFGRANEELVRRTLESTAQELVEGTLSWDTIAPQKRFAQDLLRFFIDRIEGSALPTLPEHPGFQQALADALAKHLLASGGEFERLHDRVPPDFAKQVVNRCLARSARTAGKGRKKGGKLSFSLRQEMAQRIALQIQEGVGDFSFRASEQFERLGILQLIGEALGALLLVGALTWGALSRKEVHRSFRRSAVRSLRSADVPNELLIELLSDPDPAILQFVAQKCEDPDTLLEHVGDRLQEKIDSRAIYALMTLMTKARSGIERIRALFEGARSETVRACASRFLGMHRDEDAIPILLDSLQRERSRIVRAEVATTLGKLGGEHVVSRLMNLLSLREHGAVRTSARKALTQISEQHPESVAQVASAFLLEGARKVDSKSILKVLASVAEPYLNGDGPTVEVTLNSIARDATGIHPIDQIEVEEKLPRALFKESPLNPERMMNLILRAPVRLAEGIRGRVEALSERIRGHTGWVTIICGIAHKMGLIEEPEDEEFSASWWDPSPIPI